MIVATLAAAAAATVQPQTVLTIPSKHRLVEGIASDGSTIFVSSVLDRTVLACRETCRTLAVLPKGLHPLGLAWDSQRKRLWVAADCPELPGVAKCERGALLALDARGRLVARMAPRAGAFHPGDVSASGDEVIVSEGIGGSVHRLAANRQALTPLVGPGVGRSAQGSAVTADGAALIAADYSQGIATIDLATGVRTLLPRQDGKPLRGIDGLVRCGNSYLALYNGQAPGALVRFTVGNGAIHFDEPVEGFSPPDPTQLAIHGDRLLIVANAGWPAATKGEAPRAEGASIVALPLAELCAR